VPIDLLKLPDTVAEKLKLIRASTAILTGGTMIRVIGTPDKVSLNYDSHFKYVDVPYDANANYWAAVLEWLTQ
jgi:hypothetical protein